MRVQHLSVALLIWCTACTKTSDVPPETRKGPAIPDGNNASALVAALDSTTMASMEQRTGTWQDADASSEWTARLSGGKVRVITERMMVGESSSRNITHFFTDDGTLAAAFELRYQTVAGTDRPPAKQLVLMKLEFTGDSATRSEKTVDGESVPILPFEIANARKHSMDLLAVSQSTSSVAPGKP